MWYTTRFIYIYLLHELKEMRDLITLYSCKYTKKKTNIYIYIYVVIYYIKEMSASISQLQQGVHKRYAYRATPLRYDH